MSIFRNKKRTDFFKDLEKVDFKIANDFKNTLEQTKNEADKILTAITNWEKNKKHTEKDKNDDYLKSDSQKYLKEIKKACESIKNAQDNNIIFLLSKLKNELKKAYEAKFGLFTFGAVLDNKKNKKELKRISDDIDNLIKNLPTIKIGLHRELAQKAAQKVIEKKKLEEAKRKAEEEEKKKLEEAKRKAEEEEEEEEKKKLEEAKRKAEEEKKKREEAKRKAEEEEEEKKKLEEAKRKAEEEKKKREEAKRKAEKEEEEKKKLEETKRKDNKNDPGIFKGLPNGGVYCYLNTALQNLYHNSSFRRKVLGFKIKNQKEIENGIKNNIENYKNLAAHVLYEDNNITQEDKWKGYDTVIFVAQFFFEYLSGKKTNNEFDSKRKEMASLLCYSGIMESSHTIQKAIENACTRAMREKTRVIKEYNNNSIDENKQAELFSVWEKICNDSETSMQMATVELVLNNLYHEKKIHDAILSLQDNDFYSNDSTPLEVTHKLFSQWENKESIYTKDNIELYKKSGFDVQDTGTTRKQLLRLLRIPKYSKNSKILSLDSNIKINAKDIKENLVSCIENAINAKRKQGQNSPKYRLPLKENKFEVTFIDREDGRRSGCFAAEEEIDLAQLVTDKDKDKENENKLIIFSNGKELDKNKTKFKLISATIGTGRHFYLYVKKGSTWHRLDDSSHTTTSWEKIKDDISTGCETLTYKLI